MNINQTIPNFEGKLADGTSLDIRTLRGKNVVIYFYPKDNTPGCTIEAKDFRDHYAEFQQHNTEIIGISKDDAKSHCKFINDHALNFPLMSDVDSSICKLFDVLKEKSMYGKKYIGIERSTFLIDKNGILKQVWRNVSVTDHVHAVLAAVKELS